MDDKTERGRNILRHLIGDRNFEARDAHTTHFNSDFQRISEEFAFATVWDRPGIDWRTRSIVCIASLTALRLWGPLRMHVHSALNNGVTWEELKEIVIHLSVYVGMPAASEAGAIVERVLAERSPKGSGSAAPQRSSGTENVVVGLVGLGNMGGAIARRLLQNGVTLHVSDIEPAILNAVEALGAVVHTTPKDVADAVEVVFTCLPTVEASGQVLTGEGGISSGGRVRSVVELSTVGATHLSEQAEILKARGIDTLDAPVSGGAGAAEAGTLTIMVGGPDEVLTRLRPTLLQISQSITHIGPTVGDGQTMKLVNNLLAAANMATSFEALAIGVKLGLSPEVMVDVINRSSGANTGFTARRIAAISSRKFDYGAKVGLLEKDIDLAFKAAEQAGIPMGKMTALTGAAELWRAAGQDGLSGEDITTIAKIVERYAGVTIGS